MWRLILFLGRRKQSGKREAPGNGFFKVYSYFQALPGKIFLEVPENILSRHHSKKLAMLRIETASGPRKAGPISVTKFKGSRFDFAGA